MSKIEMMKQSITWKIENAEKTIREAKDSIRSALDSSMVNPIGIQHDAMRIAEAQKELSALRETLMMLESLEQM